MTFAFNGKIALITGASSGIGEEFARQLHARGCRVVVVARRIDRLSALCDALNSKRPGSAEPLQVDLGSDDLLVQNKSGAGSLLDYIGNNTIDILVNNAGFGTFGHFAEADLKRELELVRVNIVAPLKLTRAVLPQMTARNSGGIINVSSIAGMQAVPYLSTYGASKSFNLMHSLALREELRFHGVHVSALCPGPTATEFGKVANYPGSLNAFKRHTVPQVVASAIKALEQNHSFVVPTLAAKILSLPARILPRSLINRMAAITIRRSTGLRE